jgi:hypothetical protein
VSEQQCVTLLPGTVHHFAGSPKTTLPAPVWRLENRLHQLKVLLSWAGLVPKYGVSLA